MIPYEHAEEMSKLSKQSTTLILFDDMDHYRFYVLKNLLEPLLEYLVRLLPFERTSNLQASMILMKDRLEIDTEDITDNPRITSN